MKEEIRLMTHHYLDGELEGQTITKEHSDILDGEWKFPESEIHFWYFGGRMFKFNPIEQEKINRERLEQEKFSRALKQYGESEVVKKLKIESEKYPENSIGKLRVLAQLDCALNIFKEINGVYERRN